MEVLMIDDGIKAQIESLVEYAKQHPFSTDDLLDIYNGAKPPIGSMKEHALFIPVDHLVIFSVEDHGGETGLVKRLSISVKNPKFVPSPNHVKLLMPYFGFHKGLEGTVFKVEGKKGTHQYISLWEKL